MKRVRIALAHTTRLNVHDGHGGVWVDGDEPEIPDDAADILVSMGLAKDFDGSQASEARAKARADAIRQDVAKQAAHRSTSIVDEMPPEWRARVYEEGDGVIEEYLASRPSVSLEQYDASEADPFTVANEAAMADLVPHKRRGRPPGSKNKPKAEGGDA